MEATVDPVAWPLRGIMFTESQEMPSDTLLSRDWPVADLLHKLLSQLADALGVRRVRIVRKENDCRLRLVAAWQDGARAELRFVWLNTVGDALREALEVELTPANTATG